MRNVFAATVHLRSLEMAEWLLEMQQEKHSIDPGAQKTTPFLRQSYEAIAA